MVVAVLVAASVATARAGESSAADHPLPEMVVTATREPVAVFDAPVAVNVVDARAMRERLSRTTPEALQEEIGIVTQSTRAGDGSPFIRGLTGNQVLILYDGVRFNNTIFRSGPNQYLNTVDAFTLDRVEVLRGPSSSLYGADALGGTINLIPRDPAVTSDLSYGAEGMGRYASANRETTGRAAGEVSTDGVGARAGYTRRNFADLRGGRHTGLQDLTDYREDDADARVRWTPADGHALTLGYARVHQAGLDRKDQVDSGARLVRAQKRQQTDVGLFRYGFSGAEGEVVKAASATTSLIGQTDNQDRVEKNAPTTRRREMDQVVSFGQGAQGRFDFGEWSSVVIGAEYYHDHVNSSREDFNRTALTFRRRAGTFPDNSDANLFDLFAQDTVTPLDDLDLIAGGRYSWSRVNADISQTTAFPRLRATFRAFTGNVRVRYGVADGLNLIGGVSQGFRAPNVNDLSGLVTSGLGGQEVPEPDLKPEGSINYEVGSRVDLSPNADFMRRLRWEGFAFSTMMSDLIARGPGTFNGLTFVDANGNGARDAGEPNVLVKRNTGRASLTGVETAATWDFDAHWALRGGFAWIASRDRVAEEPLAKTPPAEGLAALRYTAERGGWWAEAAGEFVRAQKRLPAADKSDFRIPPGGTPGFSFFHLRGGARLAERVDLTLAVENVGDHDYRRHGSSFNGAGTNFVATLGARF
ncbi:MAG: TonB-dependent receptor [Planctomycetes bacterium]|nr:TonB-dependent receptor [Planctomycetota bacterium]